MAPGRNVQILLATYNGGRYLDGQLASLRRQDCADRISLLIRDDGSTDDTVARLERFDPGPLAITLMRGDNLGVTGCFQALMTAADREAGCFLFCDQDDVWAPGKVTAAVAALPKSDEPALYCGRSIITDAALKPRGLTAAAPRGPSFRNALIQNIAPGHTMAFNRSLLDVAAQTFDPARAIMHDHWAYLLASALGTVVFDSRPWAWYRTHGANQIGYESDPVSHLIGRAQRVLSLDRGIYTRQVRAFVDSMGGLLPEPERACAEAMVDQTTLAKREFFLRRYPLVHQDRLAQAVATILFLIGRYRDAG